MSHQLSFNPEPFSDYSSLKRYVENLRGTEKVNIFQTIRSQIGTAGTVELEEKADQTIAHVGKAGLTLVMASDVNDNAYDDQTVHIRYITTSGTKGYCYATFDGTASTTEVAFVDVATGLVAVTDFYMPDTETYGTLAVVCSVAVQAGDNVCIGITGCVAGIADPNLTYIKILAAATSPTLANCHGVGSLWGRTATTHATLYGAILTLDYITPWGTVVEGATCTLDGSNTTTEVKFLKADGTNYVMDYYRTRNLSTNVPGTTTSHEIRICDFDCAAQYGVIEELLYRSVHTRYMVPKSSTHKAWLGRIRGTVGTAIVTLAITLTPEGGKEFTYSYAIPFPYIFNLDVPIACALEPLSEVTVTINGNLSIFVGDLIIIESEL